MANTSRFNRIKVVWQKELRETLRDTRVLFGVIVSPLLLTPLLLAGAGYLGSLKATETRNEVLPVGIIGADRAPGLREALASNKTITVEPVADVPTAEAAIKDRSRRAVLVVPENAQPRFDAGEIVELEILVDDGNEKSTTAQARIEKTVEEFNTKLVTARLQSRGLTGDFIKPSNVTKRNVNADSSPLTLVISTFLPYMIVLGGVMGGATSAFDLCAGEKERGTMETLLVAPVSRTEIILGKVGAIFTVSLISTLSSILGLLISLKSFSAVLAKAKLTISYTSLGFSSLAMIPLLLMVSSVLLAISSFARNQKEAQAYFLPFFAVVFFPVLASLIFGAESGLGLSLAPILNISLVIKQLFSNALSLPFLALSLGSSLLYAAVALAIVVALFNREEILFRS